MLPGRSFHVSHRYFPTLSYASLGCLERPLLFLGCCFLHRDIEHLFHLIYENHLELAADVLLDFVEILFVL